MKNNEKCEFMCRHPIDIYRERLSSIKQALPPYEKAGFITDKCVHDDKSCWFRYRITRYLLYPALLEDSADYDTVVGVFKDNRIILFQRKKNDF